MPIFMLEGDPVANPSIVEQVTTFVGEAVKWIGDFAEAVTGNELLTLGVVILPLAGFGIGAIKRLLSQRA